MNNCFLFLYLKLTDCLLILILAIVAQSTLWSKKLNKDILKWFKKSSLLLHPLVGSRFGWEKIDSSECAETRIDSQGERSLPNTVTEYSTCVNLTLATCLNISVRNTVNYKLLKKVWKIKYMPIYKAGSNPVNSSKWPPALDLIHFTLIRYTQEHIVI